VDVRAVFFDAGETLVYPHPSFAEVFAEVLREEGHVVDPTKVQEVVSAHSSRFTDYVLEGEGRLWSTSSERSRKMWRGVYDHFLTEVGTPKGQHDHLFERLYARFTDLATYRLHPDAIPVLGRLRKTDLVLGLISNFEEWLERLLETLEVAHFFDVTVISGIEGVEKPDPQIFRIALERTGVAAEQAVYVGDHPFFDVDAAKEAGMVPVLIDRRGRHADTDAIRITSLEDLPAAVGIDA
jgi:putative hydrolase of the HAD superfamily